MNEAAVTIREQRPGDAPGFHALFREVFELDRSAAHWRWRYEDAPGGPALGAVAEADGEVVCVASVIPMRMRVGGRDVLGSHSIDVLTHPAHRGRGLYPRVARFLYERLPAHGVDLTFGFTNRNSTALTLTKLGRTAVEPFPLRIRPLRPLALVGHRLGRRPPRAAEAPSAGAIALGDGIELATSAGSDHDDLWRRTLERADIAIVRDAAHVRWRYLTCPDGCYEVLAARADGRLVGYAVWRLMERFGTLIAFLADLVVDPEAPVVGRRLLQAIGRRAAARGATLLGLLAFAGDPERARLRAAAPWPVPARLFPQPITFSVRAQGERLAGEDLAAADRWWVSWGDSDVV